MATYQDPAGRWRWRARITNPFTREACRLSGSAPKAINTRKAAATDERATIASFLEEPTSGSPKSPTLNQFVESTYRPWILSMKARSTVAGRESHLANHILPFLGDLRLDQITRAPLEAWLAGLLSRPQLARGSGVIRTTKRRAARTTYSIFSTLHSVMTRAVRSELIQALPVFPELPEIPKRKPNFLEYSEERALYAAAIDDEERALFMVAIRLGLRAGEQKAIEWTDISDLRKVIVIFRSYVRGELKPTKTYEERVLDLDDEIIDALKKIRHLRGPLIHCDGNGRYLTYGHLQNKLRAALLRAGITRKVRWHDLRHTFGSHLAIAGVELQVIRDLMGHKSIQTTEIYAHLIRRNGQDALAKVAKARAAG